MTKIINNVNDIQQALYKLADELGDLVLREHQILQGEMRQVGVLVSDAVKNLDSNFRTLNACVSEQTAILDKVLDTGCIDKDQRQKLSEIGNQINTHTSTTIRSLQFDDIVQQLAGHTCNRIAHMQELFVGLETKLTKIKQLESQEKSDIQKLIKMMQEEVGYFRVKLEKENPVKQRSMDAGKIELF